MDIENQKGIIHLWNLPRTIIYVDLELSFKQFILNYCKRFAHTWVNLGKQIGLKISKNSKCKVLEGIREGKKIRLDILFLLIDYLSKNNIQIILEDLEKKVTKISLQKGSSKKFANSIINPKLPFNFKTISGATLVSALLHDGGINSNLIPHYSNTNIELRKKIFEAFVTVFGEIIGNNSNPETNQQIYFPKVSGIILVNCLGMKKGRKTENNVSVPSFIFDCTKEIKANFLQQAFDDEGYVGQNIGMKLAVHYNFTAETIHEIKKSNIEKYAPNLLLGNINLIREFGIEVQGPFCREIYTTKDGKIGAKWTIVISCKENIKNFRDCIGFFSQFHREKLEQLVANLKDIYSPRKTRQIMLKACENLQEVHGHITSRNLAKEIGRSQVRAKQLIRLFQKEGLLKVEEYRKGCIGAKYILG